MFTLSNWLTNCFSFNNHVWSNSDSFVTWIHSCQWIETKNQLNCHHLVYWQLIKNSFNRSAISALWFLHQQSHHSINEPSGQKFGEQKLPARDSKKPKFYLNGALALSSNLSKVDILKCISTLTNLQNANRNFPAFFFLHCASKNLLLFNQSQIRTLTIN